MISKLKITLTFFTIICVIECNVNDLNKRLDCHLENKFNLNKNECLQRGCIWDPSPKVKGIPKCYLNIEKIGYQAIKKQEMAIGLEADLQLKNTAKNLLKYSPQIDKLKLKVTYLTENILRFKIYDPLHQRYEVPIQKEFPLLLKRPETVDQKTAKYSVKLNENKTNFDLIVERKETKTKLFDTSIGGLIFSDQLIQLATYLPSTNIYGMGENTHQTLRHDLNYKTWNLFGRGIGPDVGITNLYGVHPFYTCLESDGKSHGILLLNSNAIEYTLLPEPGISIKTTGGILDFYMFIGDNPEHVIQLYTSLIGRPFLPAFWAIGFQLSRYGFKNTQNVRQVLERNLKANVPLDVIYLDIDYMTYFKDFTYDNKTNFTGLPQLIDSTKKEHNLHWNLILDPTIEGNDTSYKPFWDGYKNDIYIKWPNSVKMSDRHNPPGVPTDKGVIYGHVWPKGYAAFPDFFKAATEKWWKKWISHMYNDLGLKFDALWIDMNEPFNFESDNCPVNKYDYPEVRIQSVWSNVDNNQLSNFTLCMVSLQGENNEYLHYDVHSLYALMESKVTQKVLHEVTGKRGFILSRSNFVSSGRYTAHWTGDNTSKWSQMRDSIITVLEFNLFGLNFIGADICGFFQNSTAQLCRRWSQLGAFYPFSRNHNEMLPIDQDPAVWALRGHPEVTEAAVNSINLRYSLLPYLYTLFYQAHITGHTVARPIFHEYPNDNNTHAIYQQFMWGRSLLISPFLFENQTEVSAYLPNNIWYEIWPQIRKFNKSGHIQIKDDYPNGPPPIHLRAGSIIPMSTKSKHINTETVRNSGLKLVVLPNEKTEASGDLFWDDGETIDTIEKRQFNYYSFKLMSNSSLVIKVELLGYPKGTRLDYLEIYDTIGPNRTVQVNGKGVETHYYPNNKMMKINVNLDLSSKKAGSYWNISWS